MRNIRLVCAACVLLTSGYGVAAHAASPRHASPEPQTHTFSAQTRNPSVKVAQPVVAFGQKVSASALANLSGGTDINNRVTLTGNVSDTRTRNVVTGTNTIGGSAFDHAAGLPVVIQNSGNSVLIQNATVVNLQLEP